MRLLNCQFSQTNINISIRNGKNTFIHVNFQKVVYLVNDSPTKQSSIKRRTTLSLRSATNAKPPQRSYITVL